MGVRIHALAKELDVSSKKLLTELKKQGVEAKSHLASINEDVAERLRGKFGGSDNGSAPSKAGSPSGGPAAGKSGASSSDEADAPSKPAVTGPTGPKAKGGSNVKRVPIIARRSPVTARPQTSGPQRGGPGGRGPGGPGGGGGRGGPGQGGGDGPRGRVRFFPGSGNAPPSTDYRGGPGGAPAGRRGRGGGGGGGGRGRPGGGYRGGGRRGGRDRGGAPSFQRRRTNELAADRPKEVDVQLPITIKELSPLLMIKQSMIQKALMDEGMILNINAHLTEDMIVAIGLKFDVEINCKDEERLESTLDELEDSDESEESLEERAPVCTFLGHVDHGKTSLLDKIRETRVATGEAGGITQHMSAFRVDVDRSEERDNPASVVFIDTPGHQAFAGMRARGANVTDVVVLVVAANDGPMPATEEALAHAKAAGVPIIVAIDKIDKPGANVPMVKQKLAAIDLAPPEWGGTTEMVEVSAMTGDGIDALLEVLSLETQILELKANPDKHAVGTVLDSKNTSGRGIVTTALIQEGTLRPGDHVLCGPASGKVRTLSSTIGLALETAGPSTPVEITGLDDIPGAGDRLYALEPSKARAIAEDRKRKLRESERAAISHVTLETLMTSLEETQTKEVNLILKADVKGTLDVVRKQVEELSTDEVGFKILLPGVGEISESDVLLADASDAIVLGFHVVANERARRTANEKGVEIRTYQVIYQLIEDMHQALEGMLAPETYEEAQGRVEIREIYKSSRLGNIAGSYVLSGTVKRNNPIRLVRDGRVVHEGKLSSLKRFKDDTNEVREGFECGLRIEGFNDIKVGDVVESYAILERKRKLGEQSKKKPKDSDKDEDKQSEDGDKVSQKNEVGGAN